MPTLFSSPQVASMIDAAEARTKPSLMGAYTNAPPERSGVTILENLRNLEAHLAVIVDMVAVASGKQVEPARMVEVATSPKGASPNGDAAVQQFIKICWSRLLQIRLTSNDFSGLQLLSF